MNFTIKQEKEFKYIEEGQGEVMLLLHGLFGALSNWEGVLNHYSKQYRVIIPMLPIYEMPVRTAGIKTLTEFIERFVNFKKLSNMTILGNSLGGHLALMYTLRNEQNVKHLILTGSSGLFENSMGASYPKRGTYEFIKTKVEYTFYDPKVAGKELIDEIFEVTRNIPKCLNIVAIAKSAQRHNMATDITRIKTPTLLIWGLNDTITPPMVGYDFNRLIPNSTLRFIDKCCHAPMMEHPNKFNEIVDEYLAQHIN
jgi:pimeloyl-ACP methyl ester carboxylesterase